MRDMLLALWFFIPAGVANMAPIFAAHLPWLRRYNAPIDGGKHYRGKVILGSHKTWRGIAAGVVMGIIVFWLQTVIVGHNDWLQSLTVSIDYAHLPVLAMGVLFGIGALGGDAIKSFFKRQINVPSGKSWFPFDQIDYIIGGALATAPLVLLTAIQYLWVIIFWLVLHLSASYVGYLIGLKDQPI